ncbi:hypothetical protein DSM25559_4897 [Agrobacterium rosae]|uniref:Uncharacterized protein n=1 Tax=Agrobacterium rosae TaxID=1972867 RepID=A0A1R3U8P9_9HYPH|nr:hypothetical protein DSM25559_4897 [Agrobacterium rosae]
MEWMPPPDGIAICQSDVRQNVILFVRQRRQLINALRAHLAEHVVIAPQGIASLGLLGAEC